MSAQGVSIAFDALPLDASPTWTRIDNLAGVTVTRVSTSRGRSDETDKSAMGQCQISGLDRNGTLDPTNATGPYYGKLDPVKQVAVAIWNPVTAAWARRFTGYWDQLTYTIDPSGKFATWQLDCVDAMDILADAEVLPGHAGGTPPGASVGNAWFAAAQVNDRILAAIADASTAVLGTLVWPAGLLDIFSGNVAVQATVYSTRTPLLQVIQDACDAEFPFVPNFFVAVDGKLTFRGRYARFNPADAAYNISHWFVGDDLAFASDSSYATVTTGGAGQPLSFTRGKKNLITAAYVAPQGIAASDKAGQLIYDGTAIGKYAVRVQSFEELQTENGDETPTLLANAELQLMGQYLVDNYKTPQNRPQSLVVRSKQTSDAKATRNWAFLSGVELSDLVTLWTSHPGGGGFDKVEFFVEAIKEEIVPRGPFPGEGDDITTTVEISPRAYYDTNPFTGDHAGTS